MRDPVYDGEVPLESAQDWQQSLYPENLYGGEPPSERESDTSHAAAHSMILTSNSMRARVYQLIVSYPGGWTDDELEHATGWRHQTVSARRRELVLLGNVVDSGLRRPTRSGRKAAVWVLAP